MSLCDPATMWPGQPAVILDTVWKGPVQVKADGPGGVDVGATGAVLTHDPVNDKTTVGLPKTAAENPFVNEVQHYDNFDMDWQISFDEGTTWKDVGASSNDLYLTFANPAVAPVFHTVVHIGSHNAAGETAEADVVAAIWNEFSDRNVTKVVGGTQLKYWDGGAADATDTAKLLQDANGQCGQWAVRLVGRVPD